jgi:YHS domain-containing protein
MKSMHRYLLGAAAVAVCAAVLIEAPRFVAAGPTTAPAVAAAPTTAPATQPTVAVNKHCPVSGDAVDPAVTVVYKGKTYAFCCSDCVKTFNKDPEKYVAIAK